MLAFVNFAQFDSNRQHSVSVEQLLHKKQPHCSAFCAEPPNIALARYWPVGAHSIVREPDSIFATTSVICVPGR